MERTTRLSDTRCQKLHPSDDTFRRFPRPFERSRRPTSSEAEAGRPHRGAAHAGLRIPAPDLSFGRCHPRATHASPLDLRTMAAVTQRVPLGRLSIRGRPTRAGLGRDSPGHVSPAGHKLATEAFPRPFPRVACSIQPRVRRTAGQVPAGTHRERR